MQQLIYFFQKFKYFLFFLLLQFFALYLTFSNLDFHKSKFVNSANNITGGIYSTTSNIGDYFDLKNQNKVLAEENNKLRNLLIQQNSNIENIDSIVIDTLIYNQKYTFTSAKILNNNFTKSYNFLTINKGAKNGLEKEMAVMNSKGIIGITDAVTSNYARVQSILNKNSRVNARLKNTNFFGTLSWNSKDYNIVQLSDIPRQAPMKVGDTIETDGKSTIFPEGIPIGTILEIKNNNTADNTIEVKLFNDMSNLGYVYVIKNLYKEEIRDLESNE